MMELPRFADQLLIKFLAVIALTLLLATLVVWVAIDFFALEHFTSLLTEYRVPNPHEVVDMFLEAAHRALIGAGLGAMVLGLFASFWLIKMILGPLHQMIGVTEKVANGDYSASVVVTSHDEIGQLGAAFNAMADNLQRVEQLRKKMVVDVAHELRGPLTNIGGYLEAVNNGVLLASPEILEALRDETLRLGNLADGLLRLSDADAARMTLRRQPIDLREVLRRSLLLFETAFADKAIGVDVNFPASSVIVRADPDKLAQILQNLLDNAWRYTPRDGSVRIEIECMAEFVRVVIASSGEPIAESDLPLIFERFYRVDRSRSRHDGGSGVGLAIVKELVEAHGGHVGSKSIAGENRIWFELPA